MLSSAWCGWTVQQMRLRLHFWRTTSSPLEPILCQGLFQRTVADAFNQEICLSMIKSRSTLSYPRWIFFIRLELMNWTTSWEFREPCGYELLVDIHPFQTLLFLTSVNIFCNLLLLGTRISNLPGLVCELWAVASVFTATSGVHSSLQWVTLPTKNIITMLTVTSSSNMSMKMETHSLGIWLTCHQYWKRTAESRLQATGTYHWIP